MKLRDELRLSILIVTHDLGLGLDGGGSGCRHVPRTDRGDRPRRGGAAATRGIRTRKPCSTSYPRQAGSIARSCWASRRTRPGSRRAAGSIHDARWSRRGRRRASASKRGAAGRIWAWKSWPPATSRPATRPGSIRGPVTSPRPEPSTGRASSERSVHRLRLRGRVALPLRRLVAVALQDTEDRLHLGVRAVAGRDACPSHARTRARSGGWTRPSRRDAPARERVRRAPRARRSASARISLF